MKYRESENIAMSCSQSRLEFKRSIVFKILLLVYSSLGLLIIFFDLGQTHLGDYIFRHTGMIVPSVVPIGKLTNNPNSSSLVLLLSWTLVPINTLCLVALFNWKHLNTTLPSISNPESLALLFLMYILTPIIFIVQLNYVPTIELGRISRTIYSSLKYSSYFTIVYGAIIWLYLSTILTYIAYGTLTTLNSLFKLYGDHR